MIDTLTQIPSLESLNKTLQETSHPKLMLIDLKEFKKINLKYSDEGGDFILCEFAKALESYANKNEMFCFRVEEDSFALIKDMPFELQHMEKLIFSLADFIKEQKYTFNNNEININAHIGICLDQKNHLKKAKSALNVAKKEDMPFVTYSEFVNRLLEENEEKICKVLQQALDDGTIIPYYQKVIDRNQNIVYNEMLLRNENKKSIQSPKLFLTIAHDRGFYNDIVQLVAKKMIAHKNSKAINLSCHDFFDEELFSFLIEIFKNTNTIFELQNNEYLQADNLDEKLEIIKQNNIQICLDNITSNSELSSFNKEHIDFVKVCGNLIRLLSLSPDAKSTCKEILFTCKELNIKTIASHINSDNALKEVKELNFDYFQGYFLGKPTSTFAE
ncbi:EAL domain-containing protein [Sulfurospirillum arcachonense]|uniref:EAL domain-containing protein n=1 Tax=Sulfurospirillum arcachonense TaxID=57666 RepID=UPI000469273B|nr:GGDEF domain-containing protein [Sulfurospirillum arcachonense]